MEQHNQAARRNRMKKRIILFFTAICLILAAAYGGMALYAHFRDIPEEDDASSATKFNFYDADWDEDIYADAGYMELNRYISVSDGAVKTVLEQDNYAEYGDTVVFLAGYIQTIIDGDHEAYNACFSEEYWKTHEKQNIFTPQKVYNVLLTKCEEETVTENGESYTAYTYLVEYMIYRNNGTFRRDIGSDAIGPQYLILTDRDHTIKIDNILSRSPG